MSLHRHLVRNAMFQHALEGGKPLPLRAGAELDDGLKEEETTSGAPVFRIHTPVEVRLNFISDCTRFNNRSEAAGGGA